MAVTFDLLTTMRYGDSDALRQFALAHRLAHDENADAIAAQFSIPVPSFDIGDERAREEWEALMLGGQAPHGARLALNDWLKLHAQLHQAEFDATGLGAAVDLSDVDFSKPQQFDQWMLDHQQIHQQVSSFLGITT